MALINCPECGNQVSDKATACPKCAFPLKTNNSVRIALADPRLVASQNNYLTFSRLKMEIYDNDSNELLWSGKLSDEVASFKVEKPTYIRTVVNGHTEIYRNLSDCLVEGGKIYKRCNRRKNLFSTPEIYLEEIDGIY